MTEDLYIRRNIPECMAMAWTLMSTNVKRMAKALWLPAVLVMLFAGAIVVTYYLFCEQFVLCGKIAVNMLLLLCGATIALAAAQIFLDAKTYKLLNEQTTAFCWQRAANVFGIVLLLSLIATLLSWGCATINTILATKGTLAVTTALVLSVVEMFVLIVVLFVFLCPFVYALVKYMIEPETTLRMLCHNYRVGLRNVGALLAFVLLAGIVLLIAYIIAALPQVLVITASALSFDGMLLGDPAGTPTHFPFLVAITVIVTTLIPIILRVWSVCAAYYVYASIEARQGRVDSKNDEKTEQ